MMFWRSRAIAVAGLGSLLGAFSVAKRAAPWMSRVPVYGIRGLAVRVRYAPSPTGELHLGGLRTALFNYLVARSSPEGAFILRIEDTDRSRLVEGSAQRIADDLKWCGMVPDETYVQSERSSIYREHALKLLEDGNAYRCFCTPERLEELRVTARRKGTRGLQAYDRACYNLTDEQVQEHLEKGSPYTIRMMIPRNEVTTHDDLVRGRVQINNAVVDDQVILKSDGLPTYHLAAVVDDHLMGISHVIRGEEWLSSIPKHLLLYRYFGWNPPLFAHIPLLTNHDQSKLSKRQKDAAVAFYREQGYLPSAVVNFVAQLGWTPPHDEVLTMDELCKQFSIESVHKGSAIVELEKLEWFNSQHIRRMGEEDLYEKVYPALEAACGATLLSSYSKSYIVDVLNALKGRMQRIDDFASRCLYFFDDPVYDSDEAMSLKERWWNSQAGNVLQVLSRHLQAIEEFDSASISDAVQKAVSECSVKRGVLYQPLRLVLTGMKVGAELPITMELLGRERVMERINRGLREYE